jgi:hypothetical protein
MMPIPAVLRDTDLMYRHPEGLAETIEAIP